MRKLIVMAVAIAALSASTWLGASNPLEGFRSGPTEKQAASGIKEAMARGVSIAIAQLGREDGFLKDELVRIAMPKKLRKLADAARQLGAGKYVDDLELSMNRAAEKAVPAAADVFADAVREMTVTNALDILRGPEDAGTQYFRRVTEERLRTQFMPIVTSATAESGVAKRYKALTEKSGGLSQLLSGSSKPVDLNAHVTNKAIDGLFYYVAQQEKEIRKNPLKQGSDLLRRVFGR